MSLHWCNCVLVLIQQRSSQMVGCELNPWPCETIKYLHITLVSMARRENWLHSLAVPHHLHHQHLNGADPWNSYMKERIDNKFHEKKYIWHVWFQVFSKARATTKKIEDPSDLEGFSNMEDAEKELIRKLITGMISSFIIAIPILTACHYQNNPLSVSK